MYIVLALYNPDDMCGKCRKTHIYVLQNWNQLIEGPVCETKWVIIQHPPFWEYGTQWFNYNNLLGMYTVVHYDKKVHGQSGSIVPRFPVSGILVPCWHGRIFVAAQVWHGMLQALGLGHSFGQLAWQEQLEPGSPGLLVQQMWAACMVQVGVMQVVLLTRGVLSEPVVWQLCHLGQCWLLWHCIHKGISVCGTMWKHCWYVLDSCSVVGHVSQ